MAEYLLDMTNAARSYLDGLDKKPFRQVTSKMLDLMKDPYPNDSILLKGQKRKIHRVDIGEHRIVYEVTDAVVMIEIIDKRNDGKVYKKL
jgi:mRNA interferase RelE/StbE